MTQAFNLSQLANKVNTSGQLDASAGLVNATPVANGGTGKSTNTAGTLLLGDGTSAMTELAGAATNDVVSWSGSAWVSTPTAATGAGGNYVMLTYVSPATYVKPTTVKAIKITVVGAGGNGGNVPTVNGYYYGPGGGGGGAAIEYLNAPVIPSSPIAITAGAGTNSFGGFLSATAGSAGIGNSLTAGAVGALGGVGSGGNLNIQGSSGGNVTSIRISGTGGDSILGSGGLSKYLAPSPAQTTNGNNGNNYGGGGGGALKSGGVIAGTGGNGAPGVVIIEEFY